VDFETDEGFETSVDPEWTAAVVKVGERLVRLIHL
jgi:hypothetical protein